MNEYSRKLTYHFQLKKKVGLADNLLNDFYFHLLVNNIITLFLCKINLFSIFYMHDMFVRFYPVKKCLKYLCDFSVLRALRTAERYDDLKM